VCDGVLQRVIACCSVCDSVLQRVIACCSVCDSVLQRVAPLWCVFHTVTPSTTIITHTHMSVPGNMQRVAAWHSVLQCMS